MRKFKSAGLALWLFAVGIALAVLSVPVGVAAGATGDVIIFHTNDMHSRMLKGDDNGKTIGLAEMSAAVSAAKKQNPATLWFDAGDTLHGMPRINISQGQNAVLLLNKSELNALAPGNHDYNYGAERLKFLASELKPAVLGANVVDRNTKEPVFDAYKIYTLPNGAKIGVFGLTTPETAYKTNPNNVKSVEFLDPVEVSREMVRRLRPQCDVLVAVMHMGIDASSNFTSEKIARETEGIDLVIDGHSHTTLPDGLLIDNTLIVQAGWHGHLLGRVQITLEDGKITQKTARLLNAEEVSRLAPKPDERIEKTMAKIEKRNAKLFGRVVTHTDRSLSGERALVRRQEAELGNLCADAIRLHTAADIAIINGGNIRNDIPAGDVTLHDILSVLPFANTVQVKKISGSAIRTMLEHSVHGYPATFGGFLQVSGMTFSFDPTMPEGQRVQDITVNDEPLDENAQYSIAAADFMFAGGDGYDMLKNLPTVGEFGTSEEIIADYLNTVGMNNTKAGRIKILHDIPLSEETKNGETPLNVAA